jgi:hypothetical protein
MKRRVEAGDLRNRRIRVGAHLDRGKRVRQMLGIEGHQLAQIDQHVRRQHRRRAMCASAVHEAMPDSARRHLGVLMLQPFKKRARRRLVGVKIGRSVEDGDGIAVHDPHAAARLTDPSDLASEHQPLGPPTS